MRERISSAHVLAVIAIVLALGGNALAFHLGKNSIGSKQLKKNAVVTAKIKNKAVTGAKLDLATLGAVPSAANAQTLGGLSADQIAQSSKLRCPAGTEFVAGVCFESAARLPETFDAAVETCAAAGRTLASTGEMAAYLDAKGGPNNVYYWTDTFFSDEGEYHGGAIQGLGDNKLLLGVGNISLSIKFLCVTSPMN
jgi:hypothetical protein